MYTQSFDYFISSSEITGVTITGRFTIIMKYHSNDKNIIYDGQNFLLDVINNNKSTLNHHKKIIPI